MAEDKTATGGTAVGRTAAERLGVRLPSPVHRLVDERTERHGVRLLLKRDDLISRLVPGNKWRKLAHNLVAAATGGHRTLLTFGGAYSNHLRAVAAAGQACGFATIGVVRGEPYDPLNWSLARARELGMTLTYLDRTTWRRKTSPEITDALRHRFGDFFLIPEGGSNPLALPGCAEMVAEIVEPFDVICCPVGTGGTLAGIVSALSAAPAGTAGPTSPAGIAGPTSPAGALSPTRPASPTRATGPAARPDQPRPRPRAIGFAALKGGGYLANEVAALIDASGPMPETCRLEEPVKIDWSVETDFHFGGFARTTAELDRFIADFGVRHGIRLDRIYVGKMLAGLFTMIAAGRFAPGTTIVAVVTGPAEEPDESCPQAD
ncbi:1-aminocyclopropane-1-carboxylate deaminase/D-cysteine desulfhydrase [Polymorphospora rubra]|uniref:1-aminocyclopropane-1-carboxylate deaminase/D-cysteine desulfhydrase n=1 Tax=Polymorphospora rubra TaxID=338584 RepID=UPI0033D9D6EE